MSEGVRLYAGTQDGLVIVEPRNGAWEMTGHAFPDSVVDSISGCRRSPERVYAGIANDGLYRTDDAGRSWRKVFDGDVRSTTVDPTDEDVIYTGTEPPHLYRSEDRGGSWQELTGLQALPEEVRAKWWAPYPPNLGHVTNIFVHPDDSKILYLALEHGGIMRSLDRGETWEDVSKGIDYLDIHVVANQPGCPDHWFASSARGFFTTDDPAKGWVRAETGFTRDYFHDFIFLAPEGSSETPTMLIATADHSPGSWQRPEVARAAVFRSVDGARSWQRVEKGFDDEMKPMVWALTPHPTEPNAAFAGVGLVVRGPAQGPKGPGSVHMTRDRGMSWEELAEVPGDRVLWAAAR